MILDDRTCTDGTCLLLSDTPAGGANDQDLPHTARCEAGYALCVLGCCEIMEGDLVEFSMNYGNNSDHVLRENNEEEEDADEEGEEENKEEDEGDDDEDENQNEREGSVEDDGEDKDQDKIEVQKVVESIEDEGGEKPGNEGENQGEAVHRSKRRKA